MKRTAITLSMVILLAGFAATAPTASAQQREDVIWARDVEGAAITLDGALDEAVWQQAEMLEFKWEQGIGLPGSGWDDFFGSFPGDPTDPIDATVYVLRDGNTLWIGAQVNDKSVGGGRDFFRHDGLVMSIINRNRRLMPADYGPNNFPGAVNDEFFYSWLNPQDTTATGAPQPGIGPTFFKDFGIDFGNDSLRTAEDIAVWDGVTVVDGMSNDDTNGTGTPTDDVGYTMEMRIDVSALGYDLTDAEGDRVAISLAVYDFDYAWPADINRQYLSRVWWQNPWGNDFPHGVAWIHGDPGVTVSSGAVPDAPPDMIVPNAPAASITIDGVLDEAEWDFDPQMALRYQAPPEELDLLPGIGPYYTHWFRPDINGDGNAATIVDPTAGQIRFFFEGNTLYVGLDTDDQAVSGVSAENGGDGVRVILRDRNILNPREPLTFRGFFALIDSSGAIVLSEEAANDTFVTAAVSLKGSSTVADPSDIDEGYQMEMAIDLTHYGYPQADGIIWLGATFFDGDFLDSQTDSYATRVWNSAERGGGFFGGPAVAALMDPNRTTATEGTAEIPSTITLYGNYPNPFNPATKLRYALPQTGDVTVQVYDVLGRRVALLKPGLQSAGLNEVTFDASNLASGMYLYRVQINDQTGGTVQSHAVGRMILLK